MNGGSDDREPMTVAASETMPLRALFVVGLCWVINALTTPGHGLNKDCAMNMEGFKNVLALRAEMEGQWGGVAPAPDRFMDLSYYQRALQHAGR